MGVTSASSAAIPDSGDAGGDGGDAAGSLRFAIDTLEAPVWTPALYITRLLCACGSYSSVHMSTNVELEEYMRRVGDPHFIGCFPADGLPHVSTLRLKDSLIVNCSGRRGGTHWVAMKCPTKMGGTALYFDSYGFEPDGQNRPLGTASQFEEYMNAMARQFGTTKVVYNKANVQRSNSGVCGHYAIYFCLHGLPYLKSGAVSPAWKGIYEPFGNKLAADRIIFKKVRLRRQ